MSDPYAPPGAPTGARRPAADRSLPPGEPLRPPAPRRTADPAAATRAVRLVGRFSLLLLAGLIASTLRLPWRLGALAFLLAAGVVGVVALVAVVRSRVRRGSVLAVSVGLFATGLVLLVQVLQATLLWTPDLQLQRCLDRAVAPSAVQQCQADRLRWIAEHYGTTGMSP